MRKPIVSGQFYESDFNELTKQIESCFKHNLGPAELPLKRKDKEIIGVIAPHAGYAFSGPCAAWSYKEIAENRFPDLYIIIGLSHSGFSSGISIDDWETPIGIVKTDRNFGRKLSEISNLPIDEDIHKQEHSIEVQLPFLQFASRDKLKELRILPIMISPDINYKEIALHIKKTIEAEKKRVVLIASSDFTHFGHNYGYVPFKDNIRESLYKLDKDAIELIKGLKTADFLKYTDKTQATICGKYPIAAMLETSKLLNAKKGFLLQYYTSGDIVNDYTNAVGYASVVVK